ncbi:MAG TPA: hypothetical protein VMB79_13515 [Jatrophihabitans sp.]|nr:hypothetical protein [Jatrophihabitans sp.]
MPTPSTSTVAAGQPLAFHIPNPFSAGAGDVIKWIVSGITKAINTFFGDLVTSALNPLLKLLGQTLLTTPSVDSLPRVGQLWENSREIAVAVYALIILVAGVLVMAYETVQTRHSIKEIAPRLVTAFLTANLSLIFCTKIVSFADAISTAVLGQGADPKATASTLTSLVLNAVTNGGIFLVFIGLGLAGILLALLIGYVIRVAATVILIAAAPLALMCHALPQTDGVARWWWRAFTGVLAIQLAQSMTLVAAMNVFLAKGGFTFFGPTADGLVNLIVTIALLYILWKIPFWILHHVQNGGGRSMLGGIVKGVIAYKTLGLIGLRGGGAAGAGRTAGGARGGGPAAGGAGPRGGGPRGPAGPRGSTGGPRRSRPAGGARTASRPSAATRARLAQTGHANRAPRPLAPPGQGVLPLGLPTRDDPPPARTTPTRPLANRPHTMSPPTTPSASSARPAAPATNQQSGGRP